MYPQLTLKFSVGAGKRLCVDKKTSNLFNNNSDSVKKTSDETIESLIDFSLGPVHIPLPDERKPEKSQKKTFQANAWDGS